MGRTVAFAGPISPAIGAVTAVLERRGYRLVRTFDLQSALGYHAGQVPCPYHGAGECTCQYIVLLAYPPPADPRLPPHVLGLHSDGQQSRVTLHEHTPGDPAEQFALISALVQAALLLSPDRPSSPTEP